ncbi:MAG: hypothetical protein AVDCRST_MAG61-2562 [uncultured Friedmanniella sp.]|uniref:Uncharacterized protein n=1 Tax=uncultured Friedmanniella sp. TaxID=335381 RepID=A0A6J4L846_9ACTN|nr:MAG: hypothetical protein AVDCRST_MAG61-2562 [uncultured Friedmanniella sp.]
MSGDCAAETGPSSALPGTHPSAIGANSADESPEQLAAEGSDPVRGPPVGLLVLAAVAVGVGSRLVA